MPFLSLRRGIHARLTPKVSRARTRTEHSSAARARLLSTSVVLFIVAKLIGAGKHLQGLRGRLIATPRPPRGHFGARRQGRRRVRHPGCALGGPRGVHGVALRNT